VLSNGETIVFGEAPTLCAQCHGTTWRDWEQGMHGRANDYWDVTRGAVRWLSCVECHDPHAPAFDPMQALPGPNTLRMGDPRRDRHLEVAERRNPLRYWYAPRHRAQIEAGRPEGEQGEVH
jgi:hypothetical protein